MREIVAPGKWYNAPKQFQNIYPFFAWKMVEGGRSSDPKEAIMSAEKIKFLEEIRNGKKESADHLSISASLCEKPFIIPDSDDFVFSPVTATA